MPIRSLPRNQPKYSIKKGSAVFRRSGEAIEKTVRFRSFFIHPEFHEILGRVMGRNMDGFLITVADAWNPLTTLTRCITPRPPSLCRPLDRPGVISGVI